MHYIELFVQTVTSHPGGTFVVGLVMSINTWINGWRQLCTTLGALEGVVFGVWLALPKDSPLIGDFNNMLLFMILVILISTFISCFGRPVDPTTKRKE